MKPNKIILITAGLFILLGVILSGTAIALLNTYSANNEQMHTYTRTVEEDISEINISVDMSDVHIIADDTDRITLEYYTEGINQYDITTSNNTLYIKSLPLKWYEYCFNFDSKNRHDIVLKVPKDLNAELKLSTDLGDTEIFDCKFSSVECTSNCGDIDIENISGSNISLFADCGDIEGTILGREADYSINAETSLGDKNIKNKKDGQNSLNAKARLGDIEITFKQ